MQCREEIKKNMENDNGQSFLTEVEDQLTIAFLKIFECVEQFSVGAVRIALDSYENIGKKGNGRTTSCLLSISETHLYFSFLVNFTHPYTFFVFFFFPSKRSKPSLFTF